MKKQIITTLLLTPSFLLFSEIINPQFKDESLLSIYQEEPELYIEDSSSETYVIENRESSINSLPIAPFISSETPEEFNYEMLSRSISTPFINSNPLKYSSYQEALQLLKKDEKIIMLELVQENCHYCDKMDEETLTDNSIIDYLNSNFITVKLDIHKDNLPLKISDMTPSFIFLRGENDIITTAYGMKKPDEFKKILNSAIDSK